MFRVLSLCIFHSATLWNMIESDGRALATQQSQQNGFEFGFTKLLNKLHLSQYFCFIRWHNTLLRNKSHVSQKEYEMNHGKHFFSLRTTTIKCYVDVFCSVLFGSVLFFRSVCVFLLSFRSVRCFQFHCGLFSSVTVSITFCAQSSALSLLFVVWFRLLFQHSPAQTLSLSPPLLCDMKHEHFSPYAMTAAAAAVTKHE